MATRVLLHLGDATNKCLFSNIQFQRTKFEVKSILKQSRNFKRIRNNEIDTNSPLANITIQHSGSSNSKKLLKAFLFATTFSGATFIGATIIEYERIRTQTFKKIHRFNLPVRTNVTGFREQIRDWWNQLSEGQRICYFIIYANSIVFLAWRIPRFRETMLKYFTANPSSNVICMPMLLSTFSHYNLWHLAANMYVLYSFSTAAVSHFGREHFLAFYLSSGVFSSFVSNAYKILFNRPGSSLGASGAIMGILAFICTEYPNTNLNIIFLPQFTFSAGMAIKSLMAFDTVGCILRWQIFDHAAHLGGAFFGLFWQTWGVQNIWRQRGPLLTFWHQFRNPPSH